MDSSQFATVKTYLTQLQNNLSGALAAADNKAWNEKTWQSKLGIGRGQYVENSDVWERAGVNFSDINADSLPPAATEIRPSLAGEKYQAAGVSLVIHPINPYCPTAHLNVRVFAAQSAWWFGGGMDLTPHYAFDEDCRHFHKTCQRALDSCDTSLYPQFKKKCDDYFYIRHRCEMRGIGGVFFDDFNDGDFEHAFAVLRAVGDSFINAYLPIIQKRRTMPYGTRQRQWQQWRRGRYVEFNLVYDRGTLFGLQSGGRADSILMSLPPTARWATVANIGEEEERLQEYLKPREWV